MKVYKFGDNPGFPLDQEVFGDIQYNSLVGREAIFKSLGIDKLIVLQGCEATIASTSTVVNSGLLYSPTVGLVVFNASSITHTALESAYFNITSSNVNMSFEGGAYVGAVQYSATLAKSTVTNVNRVSDVIKRRWWNWLGSSEKSKNSWQTIELNAPTSGEYLEYYHNTTSNEVFIRGAKKHYTLATTADPMQMGFADIPEAVRPTKTLYFRTNIETHTKPPAFEYYNTLYTGEVGRLLSTGTLSISQRRLASGVDTNFLHFFSFSYQI